MGDAWLTACTQSWLDEGFAPITVNSAAETMIEFDLLSCFEQLKTAKDGFDRFGKRYVSLSDMIGPVAQQAEGPIAIINSDIALELTHEARQRIQNLQPGTCIVCNRIDIDTITCEGEEIYPYGYDFFVFHASDLKKIPENGMYFGLPWWDHFLPISVLSQGVTRLTSEGIKAYHLNHEGRWKRHLWRTLGYQFISDVRVLREGADPAYLSSLTAAIQQPKERKGGVLSHLIGQAVGRPNFYAVSYLNNDYIDGAFTEATIP